MKEKLEEEFRKICQEMDQRFELKKQQMLKEDKAMWNQKRAEEETRIKRELAKEQELKLQHIKEEIEREEERERREILADTDRKIRELQKEFEAKLDKEKATLQESYGRLRKTIEQAEKEKVSLAPLSAPGQVRDRDVPHSAEGERGQARRHREDRAGEA